MIDPGSKDYRDDELKSKVMVRVIDPGSKDYRDDELKSKIMVRVIDPGLKDYRDDEIKSKNHGARDRSQLKRPQG
jgi:hypothetical protein